MAQSNFSSFKPIIEDVSEADYRAFFDSSVLRVWHLRGKDRTYRITGVQRMSSTFRGEQKKQPLVHLEDRQGREVLPLALNKTNAKTIAGLYGPNPHAWIGKTITLFPSHADVGGQQVEAIRIRPVVPGTGVERRTNRQGVTVLRQLPEDTVADAEFEEPSEREPGDDSNGVDDVIR